MRWLILGAGALGGYYGGRLLEAGADVTFLLREQSLARLRESGLTIESPRGDLHFPDPPSVSTEAIDKPYDVILVACKAYDLDSAMEAFAPAVGADTAILPLLNGLSHLDTLSARFGAEHVLGGLCLISAVRDEEGTIRRFHGPDTLNYGELDGSRSERVRAIESEFSAASFQSRASEIITREMWEKWVLIATVAGMTCLMRAAIGDIVRAGAADIATALYEECAAIAAANDYAPRPDVRRRVMAFLADADSNLTASMLKDIERGAPIEGEHIVGELIARAESDTELHLLPIVHAHLKAYEARRNREHQSR
jgi:2-dehydropantoate 2-reductase